jgi:nitrite reductase/ring-hydroxylating ferredoxin subunit
LHSAAQANVRRVAFASAASIVVPGLASGTTQGTLPWSWYSDSELLRREQERIFQRGWQYAGPAEQAEPGDYFTCNIGDVPVVVTRDRSGELHALLNVCRHRGSIVVEGRGNRETLQCRYHAWTYGLDGRLRAAPRSREEPGFDADGIALRELAIERWGPLLFVHVDPDAPPLAETLGPLPELLGEGGIELDRLRFRRRSELEIACTGRSPSRTTSSATTARWRTQASARSWTSRRMRTGWRRTHWARASAGRQNAAPARWRDSSTGSGR